MNVDGTARRKNQGQPQGKDISSRGLRLKNGDMLQSTCVYDSSERDKDTYFGPETSDEMCWVTLVYLPYQRSIACDGASWNGVLREGDDPRLIPLTHPHPDHGASGLRG